MDLYFGSLINSFEVFVFDRIEKRVFKSLFSSDSFARLKLEHFFQQVKYHGILGFDDVMDPNRIDFFEFKQIVLSTSRFYIINIFRRWVSQ